MIKFLNYKQFSDRVRDRANIYNNLKEEVLFNLHEDEKMRSRNEIV